MKITKALFFRRGFGISQDYLAKKLGISRPTLTKKEKGELDFTKTEMEIYTEILKKYKNDLTLKEIFFENNFTI
ncbi:helix-turn-helix transcriptional regulator [uncultured Clostridium sp.]|uniref:helix-turn-helix domain-containing protein n=1 Tax=uncultured Clostridium sp. TaxID=59620 RepID=UPI002611ED41|nr:helix-turn-helix transcriptional regulator [uncultured Clostridium sp.]